jgi:mono/diheme cytochrome c family protein
MHRSLARAAVGPNLIAVLLAGACALGWAAEAPMAPAGPPSPPGPAAEGRGELLYRTHCIACHTTQMHWRDRRLATSWQSLKALVWRWQTATQLRWTDADVTEVARFLNDTIYGFPQTSGRVSLASQATAPD